MDTPQDSQAPVAAESSTSRNDSGHSGKKVMPWVIALAATGLAIGLVVMLRSPQGGANNLAGAGQVVISSSGFSPATIRVKKGKAVTWTNQDTAPHQIKADQTTLGLDTGESLASGDAYSYTFVEAGTYTYHDPLHPASPQGIVVVE